MSVQTDDIVLTDVPGQKFHDEYFGRRGGSRAHPRGDASPHGMGIMYRAPPSARDASPQQIASHEASVFSQCECDTVTVHLNAILVYDESVRAYFCEFDEATMRAVTSRVDLTKVFVQRVAVDTHSGIAGGSPLFLQIVDRGKKLVLPEGVLRVKSSKTVECSRPFKTGTLFETDPQEPTEKLRKYGAFSIDAVTSDVIPVPEKGRSYYRVPVYPNLMYVEYALKSSKNSTTVISESNGSQYVNILEDMYRKVVGAYEDLCRRRDERMHNLSECSIIVNSMEPLQVDPSAVPFVSISLTLVGIVPS